MCVCAYWKAKVFSSWTLSAAQPDDCRATGLEAHDEESPQSTRTELRLLQQAGTWMWESMRSVNGTQGVTSLDMNWIQIIIQTLKYGLNKHGACWWRYHLHMVRMMPRSFTGVNFWDTSFAVAQKHLTYWPWRYQWWGNMCCSFGQNYYAYLNLQIYIQLTRASQILSLPLWFTMHKHRWSESNLWLLNAAGVDHLMTHVLPKNSWCSYLIIILTVSYIHEQTDKTNYQLPQI